MILVFGGDSDMFSAIQRLLQTNGESVVPITRSMCNVTDRSEVFRTIYKYKPRVVINLAGISNLQPIKNSSAFDWENEITVNLIGSYNVAKVCVEVSGDRVIVFIGSVAGKYGKANHSGYSASKAGVISLVQSLAQEGYNAYCISPGRVDTKLRERDFPGERKETRLKPSEIARVVKEIIDGKHQPGDNLIIRKRGTRTLRRTDRGEPWKSYLNIGGEVVK